MRKQMRVQLHPIQRNIFLTALARSVNGQKGFGAVLERQRQIVRLGREVWDEVEPASDVVTFNVGLGAALKVCTAARDAKGLAWAEELWRWAMIQEFELNGLAFQQYAMVLETYQRFEEVDDMIDLGTTAGATLVNHVFLGAVVNTAAERKDWKRAENVWERLVKECAVEPTVVEYIIMSKAYMLSGRVLQALQILDEVDEKVWHSNFLAVKQRAQLLLLMCHSSPTPQNLCRLQQALDLGEETIKNDGTRIAAGEWIKIKRAAQRLQGNKQSVRLREVLIEWNARAQSVMKQWPNHVGGSQYLEEAGMQ